MVSKRDHVKILLMSTRKPEITKRQHINFLNYSVIPPTYSKLKPENFTSNNTDFSILEGSTLEINATANKEINSAYASINDRKEKLAVNSFSINGSMNIHQNTSISLFCTDLMGIKNINPPTNRIKVIIIFH